jgi:hypothetical protein
MIYLDHNATTPVAPEVLEAMLPYLTTEWGNPSSSYAFGRKLKTVVETARAQVAELIRKQLATLFVKLCASFVGGCVLLHLLELWVQFTEFDIHALDVHEHLCQFA